jgi:hypothetical protein
MSKIPKRLFKDMPLEGDLEMSFAAKKAGLFSLPQPDPNDPRFSAFFIELDANTQYFKAYGNSSHYMDIASSLISGASVKAWRQWAIEETKPIGPTRRTAFINSVADGQTSAMIKEIDALMLRLLRHHFPGPGGNEDIDAVPYLGAMEVFAKDQLPVDNDRLTRVGGGGDDVSHHRMDGFGMWFHWAAVFDSARFIPNGGGETPYRTLLVAAAAFGSAFDSAFRKRGKTRSVYKDDEPTNQLLRTDVMSWIADAEAASAQARELCRIFLKPA